MINLDVTELLKDEICKLCAAPVHDYISDSYKKYFSENDAGFNLLVAAHYRFILSILSKDSSDHAEKFESLFIESNLFGIKPHELTDINTGIILEMLRQTAGRHGNSPLLMSQCNLVVTMFAYSLWRTVDDCSLLLAETEPCGAIFQGPEQGTRPPNLSA